MENQWLSGVIDRLHVFRDPLGLVERIELIDLKTDAVKEPLQLTERYTGQMEAYRNALRESFGDVPIACRLLSTRLRGWVEV